MDDIRFSLANDQAVSPDTDQACMKAVEFGDMEAAGRIVMLSEAMALGYNSVSEMQARDPEQFARYAKQWRERQNEVTKTGVFRDNINAGKIDNKLFRRAKNEQGRDTTDGQLGG